MIRRRGPALPQRQRKLDEHLQKGEAPALALALALELAPAPVDGDLGAIARGDKSSIAARRHDSMAISSLGMGRLASAMENPNPVFREPRWKRVSFPATIPRTIRTNAGQVQTTAGPSNGPDYGSGYVPDRPEQNPFAHRRGVGRQGPSLWRHARHPRRIGSLWLSVRNRDLHVFVPCQRVTLTDTDRPLMCTRSVLSVLSVLEAGLAESMCPLSTESRRCFPK